MKHHTSRILPTVLAAVLVLGACGGDDDTAAPEPGTEPTEPTEPVTEPTDSVTEPTAQVPVPVTDVYEGVSFYPACGNETLTHEGMTWYQVQESDFAEQYAAIFSVDREEAPALPGVNGFARVAPPGPGDDTGTLVVWADGVARFVSDSRDLTAWLVDDELTYDWVC